MQIERIVDAADSRLVDYTSLTDVARRRVREPAEGLYIAESSKVISRAIAAGHRPRSLLMLERWLPELEALVSPFDGPIFIGSDDVLEAITGFSMHRGALASMHRPTLPELGAVLGGARRILVLEDIVDHTNVGAIFRSAAGLGADAVLVTPRSADPLYRRSVRVSMGTVLNVPWTRLTAWPGDADVLKRAGFHLAALALADDARTLDELAADPPERLALLLGTEGDGLSRGALDAADSIVRIPMSGGVDSLNVAAASAVALFALRVRH